ncbi:yif1a, partial [Symbiodinium necroappetens]
QELSEIQGMMDEGFAKTQEQLFAMDAAAANRTGEQTKQIFEKIDASQKEQNARLAYMMQAAQCDNKLQTKELKDFVSNGLDNLQTAVLSGTGQQIDAAVSKMQARFRHVLIRKAVQQQLTQRFDKVDQHLVKVQGQLDLALKNIDVVDNRIKDLAKQSSRQFEELRHGQQRQMTALLAVVQKLEVLEEKIDDIPVAVRESRFQDFIYEFEKLSLALMDIFKEVEDFSAKRRADLEHMKTTQLSYQSCGSQIEDVIQATKAVKESSAQAVALLQKSFKEAVLRFAEARPQAFEALKIMAAVLGKVQATPTIDQLADASKLGPQLEHEPLPRTWGLWLILTLFAHEASEEKLKSQADTLDPDAVLVMEEVSLEEAQVVRRNRLLDAQEAAAGITTSTRQDSSKQPECKTRVHWLRGSTELIRGLAASAGKCISYQWKDSQQLGCVASAWCLIELPAFVQTAVHSIDSRVVSKCLTLPEKSLQLAALLLIAVVSSIRLPLNAQNIASEFLRKFHGQQQVLIESLASGGEGPYDTIARWLHEPLLGLPNEHEFRCLVSFMIGQCIKPPLAAPPSLDLETAMAPRGKELVSQNAVTLPPLDSKAGRTNEEPPAQSDGGALGAPPVAECGPPPAALIDKLAQEVLKEDQRLQDLTGPKKEGPIFSTMLCHLLYALAVMVPAHPKEAAQSVTVRGAAFAQLIKVQHIVAQQIQPKALYDPADAGRAKLLLYVRATASVRSALQSIMASWFAADFGARFVISEEGGQDFLRYCCKHITQAYNHKTAMTRVLGSPWERIMLSQGRAVGFVRMY